jgi:hypothetical protein
MKSIEQAAIIDAVGRGGDYDIASRANAFLQQPVVSDSGVAGKRSGFQVQGKARVVDVVVTIDGMGGGLEARALRACRIGSGGAGLSCSVPGGGSQGGGGFQK